MAHIFRYLDTNGDGTGTKIATVNGSVTPQVFKLVPTQDLRLSRMIVHVEMDGTWQVTKYGSLAALDPGIEVGIYKQTGDVLKLDLLDGLPIKTNGEWARVCYDAAILDSLGAGNTYLSARWTFAKAGRTIYLHDDEYIAVTINDDLSTLTDHTFMIQGVTV